MKVSPKALQFSAPLEFKADAQPAAGDPRPFGGIGYSGGIVTDHWFWEDGVIIDLASTRAAKDEVPILWAHDHDQIIGRAKLSIDGNVSVDGVIYDDADGQRILGKPGHPWQMSVGIKPGRIYRIQRGETLVVNGLSVPGPCAVFYDSVIEEVSICTRGADSNTSASLFQGSQPDEIEIAENTLELSMTQAEIDALVAQVAQLTAANTSLTAEVTNFKNADATRDEEARIAQIKEVFGADATQEKAAPYMAMEATQFAAAISDLRAVKASIPKPQTNPVSLFGGGVVNSNAPAAPAKSALVLDAERRAEFARK